MRGHRFIPLFAALLFAVLPCGASTDASGRQGTALQAGSVPQTKPDGFDENSIVASIGIISDTHIKVENPPSQKFVNALRQMKEYASLTDGDGIDAVLVVGDLITNGKMQLYEEVDCFKAQYEQVFDPCSVPMIYTLGNHDVNWRWSPAMVTDAANISSRLGPDYFLADLDDDARTWLECRHCLVKGVHVLCITPDGNASPSASYNPLAVAWLDNRLKEITTADPEAYVVVITHPMIYNTVYGSDLLYNGQAWYSSALTATLSKYPQVLNFSGHLHFPLNDPRCVMQGSFTSFGTGAVSYMAIENGGYQGMSSPTTMSDKDLFSQGLLYQVDKMGNARVTRMDFFHSAVIGQPLYLQRPDPVFCTHLKRYSRLSRQLANASPVISDIVVKAGLGSLYIPVVAKVEASDDEMIHHFEVSLKIGDEVIWTKRYLNDFYMHPDPADISRFRSFALGSLTAGMRYTITVKAYDSWDAVAEMSRSFLVHPSMTGSLSLYADLDFKAGKVFDRLGTATVENRGATIGHTTVSHKGVSYDVEAFMASTGKYAVCTLDAIGSMYAMVAFASSGFTVEAFYVDKKPGPVVHGIASSTQKGGWGLAVRANSKPYFIVGDFAYNSYKWCDAAEPVSKTELTHLVAVYDSGLKMISLYVNGVLSSSHSIVTPFFPGIGDTFNRFCLGADVSADSEGMDYPASDMVITDVKIYSGAMDAAKVAEKYQEAVLSL